MKLKQAVLSALAVAGLGISLFMMGTAQAAVSCPTGSLKPSAATYAECNIDSDATADTLLSTVSTIINAVLGILGVVAVVVMIMGGFTFMTSQGDANKVMKGRNTLIWGAVGLVVSLAAFLIVNFVLNTVDNAGSTQVTPGDGGPGSSIDVTNPAGGGNNIRPN